MRQEAIGLRIRERRRELGIRQNALAARIGVSAAYLNLIESNKRGIGGALLTAIGAELGLTLDQLDGSAERRLRETLEEMAATPELRVDAAPPAGAEELIARAPAWARLAARSYRKWRDAAEEVEAIADRLSHDPALSAAVHAMLTEVTALRSTSEILAEGGEIDAGQRARFEQIMFDQSSRLAESGGALAAYFDQTAETRRRRTPHIDAEEALASVDGLDARIEDLAAAALRRLAERAPALAGGDLAAMLEMNLRRAPATPLEAGWTERRDVLALLFAEDAFAGERAALIADAQAADAPDAADGVADFVPDPNPEIETLMDEELTRRMADALLLPAARLAPLGRRLGWDVEALARAADGDVALAMRRIACLGPPDGPRAAHISVDASGRILSRRGALDLTPRARLIDCPLWPAHRAGPGRSLAAPLRDAEDARSFAVAMGRIDGMGAEMLILDMPAAAESVYAAAAAGRPAEVGAECRICGHAACPWRREPSVLET